MDTINQIACKAQGYQWIEVGDLFNACTTYEDMRMVIVLAGTLVAMLFVLWMYASVRCMYLEYSRNKAQRTIMVLRDSISMYIMNENKS